MHAWEYWTLPASGATWMLGQTSVVADIFKCDARKMYRENWDGCRDLWKENYRLSKLARRSTLITRLSVRVAQPNVEKIYTLPALPSPLPSEMSASWWEALVLGKSGDAVRPEDARLCLALIEARLAEGRDSGRPTRLGQAKSRKRS